VSVAKVDVDVKMDKELLGKFIATRRLIIAWLGYTLEYWRCAETEKGYHFWFKLKEELSDKELCDLQFLLGDDHSRCRFNYLRLEANCFNEFNVLFSKKFKGKKGMSE